MCTAQKRTAQKGQTFDTDIFTGELGVEVHCVEVLIERFNFLYTDFDAGVIYVSEPVAEKCSLIGVQGSALYLLSVSVHQSDSLGEETVSVAAGLADNTLQRLPE